MTKTKKKEKTFNFRVRWWTLLFYDGTLDFDEVGSLRLHRTKQEAEEEITFLDDDTTAIPFQIDLDLVLTKGTKPRDPNKVQS